MVELEDIHGTSHDLKRAYARLDNSEISEENKQLLKRFLISLRRENLRKTTLVNNLNLGTRLCQRLIELGIDKPITELTQDDFDTFLIYMEDEHGIKKGGIKVYIIFLKKFLKWALDEPPKWIRELKVPHLEHRIQPADLPDKGEFDIILNTLTHPRDKALIALLADGGFRIGGLLSCNIRSVEFGKYGAVIYLNPEGTNKTTGAKGIPLTWSTGYLNQWLAVHPYKDDPEAPLFVELFFHQKVGKYEAWSYNAAYNMLRRLNEKTGIKKHLHPHLFRHKAVTDWTLDGLTEQQICHRAGWTPASKQMINVYGNFTDAEMNDRVWEHYGLKTEDKRQVTLKKCPRCGNVLRQDDRFCSQCSLVLDHAASLEMEKETTTAAKAIELLSNTNPQKLLEIMQEKVSQWEHNKEK
jgi:Site-specific recombinase XerC